MARHVLVPVVGLIAAGLLAVVCVIQVYRTQIVPSHAVLLASEPAKVLALVDLQPEPAEDSLKPINFKKNKAAIVHESARFSACVDSAATVDEGMY